MVMAQCEASGRDQASVRVKAGQLMAYVVQLSERVAAVLARVASAVDIKPELVVEALIALVGVELDDVTAGGGQGGDEGWNLIDEIRLYGEAE